MKKVILACGALCIANIASAGLITVDYSGNDCGSQAAVFGPNFKGCAVNGSTAIVKFEDRDTEYSNEFLTIGGHEFDINGNATGDWSYDQGTADPDIYYWTAKGGPGFVLHYMVDDLYDADCAGDGASTSCLDLALAVSSGEFATPINEHSGRRTPNYELSHISFFGGVASVTAPPTAVPEPAALMLLALGLLGLGLVRRRSG